MNPDLESLIRLQHTESALKAVEARLADAPKRRAEVEQTLARERGLLETARTTMSESAKSRRVHEGALSDLETKRSKYKGQLMDVKTNKEYTAVLHEIEGVERDIRGREDLILVEMERAEALGADVKREEAHFKTVEERHKAELAAVDAEIRDLTAAVERARSERDAVAATVGEDAMALYRRIAKLRGVAVAAARDGMCQQCHLTLRPQFYVDLKRNEDLVQCPACNRILHYEAPVPVVHPPE